MVLWFIIGEINLIYMPNNYTIFSFIILVDKVSEEYTSSDVEYPRWSFTSRKIFSISWSNTELSSGKHFAGLSRRNFLKILQGPEYSKRNLYNSILENLKLLTESFLGSTWELKGNAQSLSRY